MRLNHYILTSALSHLLFLSFLITIHPKAEVSLPVFDVKLVGPIESPPRKGIESSALGVRREAKTSLQNASHKPATRRTPSISDLPPKTIHGEGEDTDTKTGSTIRKEGSSSSNGLKGSAGDTTSPYEPSADGKGIAPSAPGKVAPKPKSFLFDKETIERFAKKEPLYEKELNFDTSDLRHRGYLRMLKEKIESIWKYPYEAATRGISGDLYIRFSIKKNGRIGEIELIRTSGHKDLDSAAMKAIKDGEPYWPLPQDWDKDELTITGHFIYMLGGFYIM